jgi:predicted metal-dependent hydrolase
MQKVFKTDELGDVLVTKRRGARYLRMRLNQDGQVLVSIPYWTPYRAGLSFAISRKSWIEKHRPAYSRPILKNGDMIGKKHRLIVEKSDDDKLRTRLKNDAIYVKAPASFDEASLQAAITSAAERALKKEALEILPDRLDQLAAQHGFKYSSLVIKRMTSRWGSCNSDKRITLNYFLMQLPWEMIDYVLIHELAHTKQLNHSSHFWAEVERVVPEPKKLQKIVRQYKTRILPN